VSHDALGAAERSLSQQLDPVSVVLRDLVDGEWIALPDNPGGLESAQTTLDAIAAA
jgi:hypothetical protein